MAAALLCALASRAGAAVLQYVGALRNGDTPVGLGGAHGIDISPDGKNLYVASFVDYALVVLGRNLHGGFANYVETHFDQVGGVDGLMSATSVAVAPDGNDVYVASYFADALATFRRDPMTGTLRFNQVFHNENVSGLSSPRSIALSPDGDYVYAATYYDDSLVVFRRDSGSGRLDHLQTLSDGVDGVDGLFRSSSVTVSPDGTNVYVCSEGGNAVAVFVRAGESGELAFVEAEVDGAERVTDLIGPVSSAVSPEGSYVYALATKALVTFRRDPHGGALEFLAASRVGISEDDGDNAPTSVTLSHDGRLAYVTLSAADGVSIFQRSALTGQLTLIDSVVDGAGGIDGIAGAHDVAVSPDDQFVYVTGQFDDAVATFRVDASVCAGNCNADALVTIEELVGVVGIANGQLSPSTCPAGNVGTDAAASMSELVQALACALRGGSS